MDIKMNKECRLKPFLLTGGRTLQDYLNNKTLYKNPAAMCLILEQCNPFGENTVWQRVKWREIFRNPEAIPLIDEHWERLKDTCIDWTELCRNPAVGPLIENHRNWLMAHNKIVWWALMSNASAAELIKQYWGWIVEQFGKYPPNLYEGGIEKNPIPNLCSNRNPIAINLIATHWDWFVDNNLININMLCRNSSAFELIITHWEWLETTNSKGFWDGLCSNPAAIHLIENRLNALIAERKMNWEGLCSNPAAIHLIEAHWNELISTTIDMWYIYLCYNPNASLLIEKHWDWLVTNHKIHMWSLCNNPNAIELIERHWDWFVANAKYMSGDHCWNGLCSNPAIFDTE